jgi:hypothetical protein
MKYLLVSLKNLKFLQNVLQRHTIGLLTRAVFGDFDFDFNCQIAVI